MCYQSPPGIEMKQLERINQLGYETMNKSVVMNMIKVCVLCLIVLC